MKTIKITKSIDLSYVAEQANENGNWLFGISECGEMYMHRPGGATDDMPAAVFIFETTRMHNEMFDPSAQWDADSVRAYIEDAGADNGYRIECKTKPSPKGRIRRGD